MENGPGQLNKAASAAYQRLPLNEREELRSEVKERKMTRKDVMRRSDKIFARIQKLVGNSIANLFKSSCVYCMIFIISHGC